MDSIDADVVVLEDVWGPPLARLEDDFKVVRSAHRGLDVEDLAEVLQGARSLVVRNRTLVTSELIGRCPDLKAIARAGVGLDNIDVSAADQHGVVVIAPLGSNAVSVAEHSVAMALALFRHILPLDRGTRSGGWDRRPGRELAGKVWGLLGAGATGRACARLARAFGMQVVAFDPYISPDHQELRDLGIELTDLVDVARRADVLSCHLPATEETVGLVGTDLIERMKPSAVLVSVGRGEVVDEGALAVALTEQRLAGAALDVRAEEPPIMGILETLDNVILTPHTAGITSESQGRILEILADELRAVLSGAQSRYAVGRTVEATS